MVSSSLSRSRRRSSCEHQLLMDLWPYERYVAIGCDTIVQQSYRRQRACCPSHVVGSASRSERYSSMLLDGCICLNAFDQTSSSLIFATIRTIQWLLDSRFFRSLPLDFLNVTTCVCIGSNRYWTKGYWQRTQQMRQNAGCEAPCSNRTNRQQSGERIGGRFQPQQEKLNIKFALLQGICRDI